MREFALIFVSATGGQISDGMLYVLVLVVPLAMVLVGAPLILRCLGDQEPYDELDDDWFGDT